MIQKFLEYLKYEKKYSFHTIVAYENDLRTFKSFCIKEFDQDELDYIHYNQIRSWIVYLVNENKTNRSINRKISSLKSYYKFLQKIEQIKKNPLDNHKSLKIQKKIQIPFTEIEVENVIENIYEEDKFILVRNKLIVELFYSTGVRRNELINIKVLDINFYNNTIKVLGKRKKERFVPLLNSVKTTLIEYIKQRKLNNLNNEYLLVSKKGFKIYENLVYRIINLYFGKVSTKVKKSPHILRHTFATHLLNHGASLNSVKELLGHSSLASTQVYTHNSLEQLKKVFNQAHPRSKK